MFAIPLLSQKYGENYSNVANVIQTSLVILQLVDTQTLLDMLNITN